MEEFLDAMALFLVPPGAGSTAACCLDLPLADSPAHLADHGTPERPALGDTTLVAGTKCFKTTADKGYPDQDPPTLTLRVARNGQFNADEDQRVKDLVAKIMIYLRAGRRFHGHQTLVKNSNSSA